MEIITVSLMCFFIYIQFILKDNIIQSFIIKASFVYWSLQALYSVNNNILLCLFIEKAKGVLYLSLLSTIDSLSVMKYALMIQISIDFSDLMASSLLLEACELSVL